jgi:hypothetical protein
MKMRGRDSDIIRIVVKATIAKPTLMSVQTKQLKRE